MSYQDKTNEIKARWRDYLEEITAPAKYKVNGEESYICPVCGQHGQNGDGMTYQPGTNTLHCFGCGFVGSDIDLDIELHGGDPKDPHDFMEARQRVADIVGVDLSDENRSEIEKVPPRAHEKGNKDTTHINRPVREKKLSEADLRASRAIIEKARAGFESPECIAYLEGRGIDIEKARRAGVGFIKGFVHPNATTPPRNPGDYVIFPNASGGCTARAIDPDARTPKMHVKPTGLFFLDGTGESIDPAKRLFVVEGESDALTIGQNRVQVVATCSTEGRGRFVEWLKDHWPEDGAEVVLCYDQDERGQKAEADLQNRLRAEQIPAFSFNLSGQYKDANEAYLSDQVGFLARLTHAETMEAPDPDAEIKEKVHAWTVAGRMPDFEETLKNSAPPTPTGFQTLDDLLNGGIREGLIIVGAVPSLGKTTFLIQMLDQIVSQAWEDDQKAETIDPNTRRDALIFSLEESANSLIAKMISRRGAEYAMRVNRPLKEYAKSSDQILNYQSHELWKKDALQLYELCKNGVMKTGEKFAIIDGRPVSALEVRESIEEYKTATGRTPIVLIDYLQIMKPMDPKSDLRNTINENLTELANLSHEYNTPIVVISSFNRQSYGQGVNYASAKESGNVEYSADIMIGLQFENVGGKNFDEKKARKQDIRKIELIIQKNRRGKTNDVIKFDYMAEFNLFIDRGLKDD